MSLMVAIFCESKSQLIYRCPYVVAVLSPLIIRNRSRFLSNMKSFQICVTGVVGLPMMIRIASSGSRVKGHYALTKGSLGLTYVHHHSYLQRKNFYMSQGSMLPRRTTIGTTSNKGEVIQLSLKLFKAPPCRSNLLIQQGVTKLLAAHHQYVTLGM